MFGKRSDVRGESFVFGRCGKIFASALDLPITSASDAAVHTNLCLTVIVADEITLESVAL